MRIVNITNRCILQLLINNSNNVKNFLVLSLVAVCLFFCRNVSAAYDYNAVNTTRLIFPVNGMYCFNVNDAVDTLSTPVACTNSLSSYIFGLYYATFDLYSADVGSSTTDLTNFSSLIEPNGVNFEICVTGAPDYVYGCTDSNALNFNPSAQQNDGSCINPIHGCIDEAALNFYVGANVDDGSCIYATYGCTDAYAINFDPSANMNDYSCISPTYGCIDENALNFNPSANRNDDSCIYPE
jgi:hypothetical protein